MVRVIDLLLAIVEVEPKEVLSAKCYIGQVAELDGLTSRVSFEPQFTGKNVSSESLVVTLRISR